VRNVPNFYRDIATDKFFRRLWRIVVPDYKEPVSTRLRKTLTLTNTDEIIKQHRFIPHEIKGTSGDHEICNVLNKYVRNCHDAD